MKKNLFLDMDGVFYSLKKIGPPSILTAALNAAKRLNLSKEVEEKLIKASETMEDDEMYRPYWDLVNCKEFETSVFNQEIVKNTNYQNIPSNMWLLSTIKLLQKKYNVTVFTDNTIFHVQEVFIHVLGCGVVESGINVYSIECAKHGDYCLTKSRGGLELFCKKRDIAPTNCILIDDNKANVDTANALGMETFLFKEGMNIVDILMSYYNKKG